MLIRKNAVFSVVAILFLTVAGNQPVFASATVVKEAVSVAFGESLAGRQILEETTIVRMEKLVLERVGASTALSSETRALFAAAGALGAIDLTGRPDAEQAIALVKSVVGGADLNQLPALSVAEMALIEARAEAGVSVRPVVAEPSIDAVEKSMRVILADAQVKSGIAAVKSADAKQLITKLLQDVARDLAAGQLVKTVAISRARSALVANRTGDLLDVGAVACVTTFAPKAEAGFYSLVGAAAANAINPASQAKAMVDTAVSQFGISAQAAVKRINAMCGADPAYNCHVFKGPVCNAIAAM